MRASTPNSRASGATPGEARQPYIAPCTDCLGEDRTASGVGPRSSEAPPARGGAFSRPAAISALGSAASAASGCKKPGGPAGRGRVSVTFSPSGHPASVVVNGGSFAGTPTAGCVASAFRRTRVPPFSGSPVTVHKSFSIR